MIRTSDYSLQGECRGGTPCYSSSISGFAVDGWKIAMRFSYLDARHMHEENSFEIRLRISSWVIVPFMGIPKGMGLAPGGGAERAQWAMQRGGSPVKDRCFQAKRRKRHPEPRPRGRGERPRCGIQRTDSPVSNRYLQTQCSRCHCELRSKDGDRRPALPVRGGFSRKCACPLRAKIHSLRILRPENL